MQQCLLARPSTIPEPRRAEPLHRLTVPRFESGSAYGVVRALNSKVGRACSQAKLNGPRPAIDYDRDRLPGRKGS